MGENAAVVSVVCPARFPLQLVLSPHFLQFDYRSVTLTANVGPQAQ